MADDVPMVDAVPASTSASRRGTDLVKLESDIQVQLQAAAQVRVLRERCRCDCVWEWASHGWNRD